MKKARNPAWREVRWREDKGDYVLKLFDGSTRFQIAARWFRGKRLGNVEELMQGEMFGNHESGNMENKS